jgi:aryl-alcohol dehydrogenase-like predicted oxidoreductase
VLDHRPEHGRAAFCVAQGIRLLCYGTLAGGFIAERWLGAPEPQPPFANRSLVKYRLIIEDFGGWRRFQELLSALEAIARRHRVSIASVAIRYVLDKPDVAVAIIGARNAAHLDDLVHAVTLDEDDRGAISRVVSQATGPRGDCYELERVEAGPHSAIMWKNQNTGGAPADGPYADAPPTTERESR